MRLLEKLIEATLWTKWWPIISLASLLVTTLVYSFGFGIRCAVCFTGALFAHEMGYYAMLRLYKVPCAMPLLKIVGSGVSYYDMWLCPQTKAWIKTAGCWGGLLYLFALLMFYEADPLWVWPILFTVFVLGIDSFISLLPIKGSDGWTIYQVIFAETTLGSCEQVPTSIRVAWAMHLCMATLFASCLVRTSYMLALYENIWLIPGII